MIVDIKKDVVDARLAPLWYSDVATGITPHEHNGSGIPTSVALTILLNLLPNKFFWMNLSLTSPCKNPATINPNKRYGENLFKKSQYALNISYMICKTKNSE